MRVSMSGGHRIQRRESMLATASTTGAAACWWKIESLFTIADARGPEIDQGTSLRWLAR